MWPTNFYKILSFWYLENKRDLPWRNSRNPYYIWLSEIILQQTRVAQGLPYFLRFSETFPTIFDLAKASEEEVLKLWQGLGYYSRARNLHAAAKMVVNDCNGVFPKTYKELIKLKGVGVYTASAVASFASNEPLAVVDGNVYRVLARIFGVYTPINTSQGEKEFKLLADSLLNTQDAATYNQAIMEFGALHCTPKKPKCVDCPFRENCYSYKEHVVSELPVKLKKTKIKKRYFTYYIIKNKKEVLFRKRGAKDIWQGLYEFPLMVTDSLLTFEEAKNGIENFVTVDIEKIALIQQNEKAHKLSHQHLYASFYEVVLADLPAADGCEKVMFEKINDYPMSVLISKFLEGYIF
ncbi:A/G-specific adenine glycosylase [Aquimarina agarilytica]|uniref:A/G-specific adenine glycosylase n=1 Tax=Aquimarina agarilytica TaxID=1087449 RepID=UPI000288542C|nr:A/G-specific adenine glycosylase [Aquimarina agarilytica]